MSIKASDYVRGFFVIVYLIHLKRIKKDKKEGAFLEIISFDIKSVYSSHVFYYYGVVVFKDIYFLYRKPVIQLYH